MPPRLEATEISEKRQKIMSPLFGGFLHLLKVTLLSGSLYLVMLFFWFVYGQDFVTIDEAVYLAWGARWASGDYYVHHLYGDRIAFYFLVSIFFRLFGVSLEVGRWIVHLFGIGLLVTTYYIGKDVYSERVGILAMLILMFSGFFQFLTYYALTDIPSVFFFAATILFFLKAFKNNSKRYSLLGGLFWVLGVFSRVSYFAVFPIIGILGLKRVVKKEITTREILKLTGSALIVPLSALVMALLLYREFIFDALQLGLLPFGKEALSGKFLRERFASLLGHRQDVTALSSLIKTLLFPRIGDESLQGALRYLIREIIFPGPIEWPSLAINRYYEIERWILLTVFLLSLLYRCARSFDMLAWIVTYGFIWLVLAPSVGRIYIVEISDRYLYPLIPAIYIQFSRLIFLFLDKIRALQGGISSFDFVIRTFKNKKLFMLVTAALLGLAIWRIVNLNIILICGAISVLVFLKVGKEKGEKGRLTFVLASLATIFLVISSFSLQIQFLNAFFYSSPIQEVSYAIPSDLLTHEEIGKFEEGIWAKMSYAHLAPTQFTEKIFMKDPLHTPGNFSGLYVWFSNDRAKDRVEMSVRWITDDFSTPKTFSGYFQGNNIKFSSVQLVEDEKSDRVEVFLEGEDHLRFSGTVLGDNLNGFNLTLDFIPNQNHYFIDWDLFQPRDQDHVFLGSKPMEMYAEDHYPIWPYRISFSLYSFQLKWRGLNRLADQVVFFNISYSGLFISEWVGVNWTNDYDMLVGTWTNDKKPLPFGNYLLWGTFSELLKEVKLTFTYSSKLVKNLTMNVLVNWNQTDSSYMHIGLNRRSLPLEIDFHITEYLHDWSVSESPRSFFGRFPIRNWSYNKSLVLAWLFSIVLIKAPSRIIPKQRIASKLKNNQLSAYFCWLVLGSLFLSSIHVITHAVPFWWDPIAHDYFAAFNLSKHSGLFFWFVFEELILVGILILGAWFVLCDLVNLITEKKHAKKRIIPLHIAKTGSLRNDLDVVNGNPAKLPIMIQQISVKRRKFLLPRLSRIKDFPNRFRKHQRISSKPKKKTFGHIKRAGTALIFTFLIIFTFFLVMRNNTRYLNQITIVQGQGYHESLLKSYLFLEGYAEEGDQVMVNQINWGKWYTKNKFTFTPLFQTWSYDQIWSIIYGHKVNFVVISEWDDYHPFEFFEESGFAGKFTILWSFAGTIGFRTTIYVVKL